MNIAARLDATGAKVVDRLIGRHGNSMGFELDTRQRERVLVRRDSRGGYYDRPERAVLQPKRLALKDGLLTIRDPAGS